ncbi:SWIM zinc finger family protein [Xylanibacillus composti]|uniref:SWIM-type domain-containing protein n=1 Tax=Xylanibacillus composti TaxID=1572762 RepID=A0A8J4H2Z0_9BACL|nr:SWIM zinc finger family protein [Xylanibacillus composti]MDT9725544.1 SWIM zinc finger family protein [Xylanibacillus composti]GIQ67638.1 hypothetical protein XYCOK13_04620 [Xylanibacillus composti]
MAMEWMRSLEQDYSLSAIQSGFDQFIRGEVKLANVQMEEGNASAEIRSPDGALVLVRIRRGAFVPGHCTCGAKHPCEHAAAVLFALTASSGRRPEMLLQEVYAKARQRRDRDEQQAKKKRLAKERKRKRELEQKWQEEINRSLVLNTANSARDWQFFTKQWFKKYRLATEQAVQAMAEDYKGRIRAMASPWPATQRLLFCLYMELEMLLALEHYWSKSTADGKAGGTHSNQLFHECAGRVADYLHQLDAEQAQAQYKSYLSLFRNKLDIGAQRKVKRTFWNDLYRYLWSYLLIDADWRNEERSRLRESAEQGDSAALIGLFHFDILAGNDEAAFARLAQLGDSPQAPVVRPSFFQHYLDTFKAHKEWERTARWLRKLAPRYKGARKEELDMFVRVWQELLQHLPLREEWEQTMFLLLPWSYAHLAKELLEQKRIDRWTDLTLRMGAASKWVKPGTLYRLEQEHGWELLPLYHHLAEEEISRKNRQGYQEAVKWLKRIRSIYTAAGNEQEWVRFAALLRKRYMRLKAFIDELEKGKLLP